MVNAPVLTDYGREILSYAIGGGVVAFTGFKAGNGDAPDPEDIAGMTDIVNPLFDFPVTEIDRGTEGYVQMTGVFDSSYYEDDFKFTEVGLFAQKAAQTRFSGDGSTKEFVLDNAPDTVVLALVAGTVYQIDEYDSTTGTLTLETAPPAGTDNLEIYYPDGNVALYAYVNDGDNAGYLKGGGGDVSTEQKISLIVAIGEASHVTVVVAQSELYASKADLEDHVADQDNPHNVTAAQVGLGSLQDIATDIYPIDIDNPGVPASEILPLPEPYRMSHPLRMILSYMYHNCVTFLSNLKTHVVEAHIANKNNPHNVTPAKIGAAPTTHTHTATQITSGVLGMSRGGTGVSDLESLKIVLGLRAGAVTVSVEFVNGEVTVEIPEIRRSAVVVAMRVRASASQGWSIAGGICSSDGSVYLLASDLTFTGSAYVHIIYFNPEV